MKATARLPDLRRGTEVGDNVALIEGTIGSGGLHEILNDRVGEGHKFWIMEFRKA